MAAMLDHLVDSTALGDDWRSLRARIRTDGYVFCRGALDREHVAAAERLARAHVPARPLERRAALADDGYRAVLISPEFNRLAYEPGLRALMANILGPNGFVYPAKVLRMIQPEADAGVHRGRFVHQDIAVVGVQDMFTVWMPLGDVPVDRGGLAVLPGSHRLGLVASHPLDGGEPGWATTDYRAGDILIVHCCTVHASLPNRSGAVRMSAECRWQLADDPVPRRLVEGPGGRRHRELFSRLFRGADWWRPIPSGLRLLDDQGQVDVGSLPPSRFVDLPMEWNRRPAVAAQTGALMW